METVTLFIAKRTAHLASETRAASERTAGKEMRSTQLAPSSATGQTPSAHDEARLQRAEGSEIGAAAPVDGCLKSHLPHAPLAPLDQHARQLYLGRTSCTIGRVDANAADEETRECIRHLLAVIRRSSTGGSPVDAEQVEHIQKVIRVLSLSEEQVSSMRLEERAQVLKIRSNALGKMRLANIVRLSVNSSDGGSSTCSSPTLGASPLSMSPPGSSSYGSPFPYRSPSSAPTAIPMQVPLTMPTCKLKVQQLPLAVPQLGSCASSSAHLAAL